MMIMVMMIDGRMNGWMDGDGMEMGMGFVMRMISAYNARAARRGSQPNHVESLPPHLDLFRLFISCKSCRVMPHERTWEKRFFFSCSWHPGCTRMY